MDEQPFSTRELRMMFHDIKGDLTDIKEQTTIHNHRMSKIEMWQSFVKGGLAILALLVVPVVIYLLTTSL